VEEKVFFDFWFLCMNLLIKSLTLLKAKQFEAKVKKQKSRKYIEALIAGNP
jgi:hypothetical protein